MNSENTVKETSNRKQNLDNLWPTSSVIAASGENAEAGSSNHFLFHEDLVEGSPPPLLPSPSFQTRNLLDGPRGEEGEGGVSRSERGGR